MAKKRKSNTRGKSRRDITRRRPWGKRLARLIFLSPLRYFLLLAIIAALLFWQWQAVTSWVSLVVTTLVEAVASAVISTLRLFGWGLLFIIAGIAALAWGLRRQKLSFIHHWNRWLGGIAFLLVIWGILAFITPGKGIFGSYSLGGKFGRNIIGYTDTEGILRLLGLFITGIVLLAPKASWRRVRNATLWLIKQFKQPGYKPLPRPKAPPPPKPVIPEPPAAELDEKKVMPIITAAATPGELKQVAQEVWQKYGESPDLVTIDGWKLPPLDILDLSPEIQFSQADNARRAGLLEEALASYGVEAKVVQINVGPTVTQFGVEPGWDRKTKEVREKDKDGNVNVRLQEVSKTRVKVERISSLANDLALALATPTIRIEAPVPGKSVVGVEMPNTILNLVSLRGVIETSAFQKMLAKSKIALALGKGAGGEATAGDLAKMPHLLIAGATGSGKTVCLNAIVCCLLLYNTPYDVHFIMIDPKRVELTMFNSIPHLASPVIVDADKALDALRWLSQEMNKRYQTLASAGVRNIEGYNKNRQGSEKMPFLVLIIDELADLMLTSSNEVEQILCRLAQLSRAVGIHLVVATQRPSVDVITGLIKANFPTRISFAVTSQIDSRTILDSGGAEKLLGSGDMLYMPTEASKPKRLQGCYLSDAEVERLVYFWGNQKKEESPSLKIEEPVTASAVRRTGSPEDSLIETARQLAQEHKNISTSYLQRKLRIGYPRAARLMEQLEEEREKEEEKQ
ncbi:MAG: DNA translocase FtsK [Dehalococcoidales bacterium]|nr:DNA translocase FtsK [Dehalococcoidales bacterium]